MAIAKAYSANVQKRSGHELLMSINSRADGLGGEIMKKLFSHNARSSCGACIFYGREYRRREKSALIIRYRVGGLSATAVGNIVDVSKTDIFIQHIDVDLWCIVQNIDF